MPVNKTKNINPHDLGPKSLLFTYSIGGTSNKLEPKSDLAVCRPLRLVVKQPKTYVR